MKTRTILFVALAGFAISGAAGYAKTTKTVAVHCAKGDSINKALNTKADVLVVEIRGLCDEAVTVRRDNVTLRGGDPETDGIQTTKELPSGIALAIVSTAGINVENLKLSGRDIGVVADLAFGVELSNCRLEGSGSSGAAVWAGVVNMTDTVITANGSLGLVIGGGGAVDCLRCRIEGNGPDGLGNGALVLAGSGLSLSDSTVSELYPIFATGGSRVSIRGSLADGVHTSHVESLADGPALSSAISLVGTASAEIDTTAIAGPLWAHAKSVFTLRRVVQTTEGVTGANLVDGGSTLEAEGASSLAADLVIEDFGNASLRHGTHVAGSLYCHAGGDAYCDDPAAVVAGSSSCNLCPKP